VRRRMLCVRLPLMRARILVTSICLSAINTCDLRQQARRGPEVVIAADSGCPRALSRSRDRPEDSHPECRAD
jgi:hypothetical protein